MIYRVGIREINIGFVEVEAESLDEAQDIALEQYENGDISWTDSEAEVME